MTTSTRSPTFRSIHGPGTIPLYVQASTIRPGSTSHGSIEAVSSKRLVPSGRISGSSTWLPMPSVSAGKARIESTIAWSSASQSVSLPRSWPATSTSSPASATVKVVSMPDERWPGMSQKKT